MNKLLLWIQLEWAKNWGYIILAGILLLIVVYYIGWKKPQIQTVYVKVPEIKEVVKWKIKKEQVVIETGKVVVLNKAEAIKHIQGLPEDFITNPKKQITSTGDIAPSKAGTDVANIIDTGTGVSEMFAKPRPLPFIGWGGESEVGGRAGISTRGKEADIFISKGLGRIGSLDISGYVEGSYYPDEKEDQWVGKAMISVSHKF